MAVCSSVPARIDVGLGGASFVMLFQFQLGTRQKSGINNNSSRISVGFLTIHEMLPIDWAFKHSVGIHLLLF